MKQPAVCGTRVLLLMALRPFAMKVCGAQDGVQQLIMSEWPADLAESYANIVTSC
jgi:hypothetical protein